jgi:hypothetical protein
MECGAAVAALGKAADPDPRRYGVIPRLYSSHNPPK